VLPSIAVQRGIRLLALATIAAACGRIDYARDGGVDEDAPRADAGLVLPCPPSACGAAAAVTAVSAGESHVCAVAGGRLHCWGENDPSRLALCGGVADVIGPRLVDDRTTWTALAMGEVHSCGLRGAQLSCWGTNFNGATATGMTDPIAIRDVTGELVSVRAIATRRWHSCGITSLGELYCAGLDDFGQLGIGGPGESQWAPVRVGTDADWEVVSVGGSHTCGLRAGGAAFCWGDNQYGALSTGDTSDRATPTAVATAERFVDLASGKHHTCALTSDSRLYCWGRRFEGQIGDGMPGGAAAPAQTTPVEVAGSWRAVGAGWFHTCGVRADGTLWCWGDNTDGAIGSGGATPWQLAPLQIGARTDWASVSAGFAFTCALTTGGELHCFGLNDDGQLGQPDTTSRGAPARVCLSG
jgi:alpha-tubulin suppressor-like RCC1 family protein